MCLIGCDREPDVVVYTARLDPPPPPVSVSPAAGPITDAALTGPMAPATISLAWDLPTGWTDTGESNQFRLATLAVGEGDDRVEVAVSRVPGNAGSITANVNRWRGQLGLPPLSEVEVVPQVTYAENERLNGFITDQSNTDMNQRAVIAWFEHDGANWFFKATGTPDAIDQHQSGFDVLIASIRPADPAPHEHSSHDHHAHD